MAPRPGVPVAIATFATAVAGCNLLFGVDGYAGSPDSAGPLPDAAGPLPDGPSTPDASFCVDGAIFCDDFERQDVQGPWDSVYVDGGTLALVATPSTGRALEAHIPAASGAAQATLTKATTTVSSTASLQFLASLAMDPAPVGGLHASSLVLDSPSTGTTATVFPYLQSDGVRVGMLVCAAQCAYTQSDAVPFASATWHTVSLALDLRPSPPTESLSLDGMLVLQVALQTDAGVPGPGLLTVLGGAPSADSPHGDFDLTIDRLVVTGQ